jgi:hypothetical protein
VVEADVTTALVVPADVVVTGGLALPVGVPAVTVGVGGAVVGPGVIWPM